VIFQQLYLLIETKRIRHKFYQFMKSSPWNYIINITHMKKSMHINESIPVTITHVKENRKTVCCLFFFDIRILITSLWYLQTLLLIKFLFSFHLNKNKPIKYFGYFVWKITILRQKIIFFFNFRGGRAAPTPLITSLWYLQTLLLIKFLFSFHLNKNKPMTCEVVNTGPGLRQAHKVIFIM
jgi:hypothetical protein